MIGRVKWFNDERGYGFISYSGLDDIFVHYSEIKQRGYKSLKKGCKVLFELIETEKGLQAHNVVLN